MEFTKTSPIKYDVKVAPGSTIKCEFTTRGSKRPIKLNIMLHVYCKHPIRSNMVDAVSSNMQNVYTTKESNTHKIEIIVPEFNDCIQSFITIQIDRSADVYEKVFLEYIKVDTGIQLQQSEKTQLDQMQKQILPIRKDFVQQFQIQTRQKESLRRSVNDQLLTSTIIPNPRQDPIRQSAADQLRASTITPNLQPKSYPFAPVDVFSQCSTPRSENIHNIQIQDIQSIQKEQPRQLNIVSKIIGKGSKTIKEPKIVIASIIRNEEKNGNLKKFFDCCEELEKYHDNIVYIFIEGDSSDDTYNILKNWIEVRDGSILEKIDMQYAPFIKNRELARTAYFAQLRNRLIELIVTIPDANEILMIDANYEWDGDIIGQLRDIDSDIAAPLAVSRKDSKGNYIFYDIWAFRKNDTEFWPFYPYAENMEFDKPIDAESVGGGYLIKRKVLEAGVKYDGYINSEQICFCNNVRKFGFSIKINPKAFIIKLDPDKKSSI